MEKKSNTQMLIMLNAYLLVNICYDVMSEHHKDVMLEHHYDANIITFFVLGISIITTIIFN